MGQKKSKSKPSPTLKVEVTAEKNEREGSTEQQKGGQEQKKTEKSRLTVQQRNGAAAEKKSKRKRTSFYETVDASEVLPYLIIGNLASSKDEDFLMRKNVKYVLNLTPEIEEPEGLEYKNVPLEDDDDQELFPYFDACFDFIHRAADKDESGSKGTVLVHSYFGMSRSSAVIIAYLMKEKKWSLREAYDHLKERHSSVNPNDNFAVQLIRYEQETFDRKRSMSVTDFRH